MASNERFYLGPLGYLQPLPSPFSTQGVGAAVNRLGGVRESVIGRASLSVIGHKREWDFKYPHLNVTETNKLRAFWHWTQPRALRFIDPFRSNLISADASMGGGVSRLATAFSKDVGTLTRVDVTTPSLDPTLMTYIDSVIQWTVPASATGNLFVDNIPTKYIPLRDLRPLTLKLKVTGTGTVQALIRAYNIAGVAIMDTLGTAVILDNTWKTVQLDYVPIATHVSCVAGLFITSTAGIRTPLVTAIKLSEVTEAADWTIGEGIGDVCVTNFDPRYLSHRYYDVRFTVREI